MLNAFILKAATIDEECTTGIVKGCAATIKGLEGLFANLLGVILSFGGIVLFIMLIVGGFKYITSGGNPQSVEGAQKTITFAILGAVLLAASYLILVLIENFTGLNVTNFQIYRP